MKLQQEINSVWGTRDKTMYRFQGTNNRSNGIYCEPEAHFSPPHGNKKSSSKMRHHHRVRSNNRSAHLPHRNDSDPDSSSDVSDGTYQESSDVHGHGHPHSGMTMTNRDRLNMVAQNGKWRKVHSFQSWNLTTMSPHNIPAPYQADLILPTTHTHMDTYPSSTSTSSGSHKISVAACKDNK